jgi:UDP-N-acetylglucosamine diphosphorylase/glucosamine-1-phosphate N-acetyltransferase
LNITAETTGGFQSTKSASEPRAMRLVIFEPDTYRNFFPVAHLRPTFALRCGCSTLYEKVIRNHPGLSVSLFCREHLAGSLAHEVPEDCEVNDLSTLDDNLLVINGNLLIGEWMLESAGPETAGVAEDGTLLYARISRFRASQFPRDDIHAFLAAAADKLPNHEIIDMDLLRWQWELVAHNAEAIESDFRLADRSGVHGWFHETVTVYGPGDRLYVASGAEIHPQVVIDTNSGPVAIESGAVVLPHSRIEGPCYIGHGTQITRGNIRSGCSFGPDCRVGGEVEESIIQGRTNKYHDGFLGHSYVGEWVNIGAQTVTSDLKNDYSGVSVYMQTAEDKWEYVPTGSQKVGSFIGDHVKTGIGTLLNTGSNLGSGSVLLASDGLLPKFVPSFCWMVDNAATGGFGFENLLEIARIVVERRSCEFTDEYAGLLRDLYARTAGERALIGRTCPPGCGHDHAGDIDDIPTAVVGLLASLLEIDPASIGRDTRLQEDLGVESIDRLRLGAVLEDAFGVEMAGAGLAGAVTAEDIVKLVNEKLK